MVFVVAVKKPENIEDILKTKEQKGEIAELEEEQQKNIKEPEKIIEVESNY